MKKFPPRKNMKKGRVNATVRHSNFKFVTVIPLSASLSLFPSFSSQNDELFFGSVLGLTPLTKFDQIFFAGEARKPLCEWLIFEAF